MASDGKWYAPQLHHDPAYRAKYATPTPVEPEEPSPSVETESSPADDDEPEALAAPPLSDGPEPARSEVAPPVRGMPPPVVKPVEPSPSPPEMAPAFSDEAPPRESIQWPELPDTESEAAPDGIPDSTDTTPVGPSTPSDERAIDGNGTGESGADDSDDDDDWVSHGPTDVVGTSPVTVAPPRAEPASVRPAFETKRPPSVVGQERPSRARLEVGRPIGEPTDVPVRATPSTISMDRPKAALTQSPSGLTEIRVYKEPAELVDRAIAAVLFLSGLAMIVGTFVDWIREAGVDTTGWERGDGIATVFAGVLGAAAAGPIFVGFRHIVPKTVAIVCGLIGAVVVGLVGLDVTSDSAAAGTSLAPGFWVTLAGSLAMIVAGVAERTSIR